MHGWMRAKTRPVQGRAYRCNVLGNDAALVDGVPVFIQAGHGAEEVDGRVPSGLVIAQVNVNVLHVKANLCAGSE